MLWPFDRTECSSIFAGTNLPISRQTDKSISSHCLYWVIRQKLMVLKWNNCGKSDWIFYCCSGKAYTHLWLHSSQVTSCRCQWPNVHPPSRYTECVQDPMQKMRLALIVAVRSTVVLKQCLNTIFFFSPSTLIRISLGPSGLETSVDMKCH